MQRVSVLIAGAGPAGAVAAWRLAEMGVDVLLLEAHAACPEDMRASTIHPPTLDMLERLDLLDALEAQGLRAPVYQYRNRTTEEVLSLDMRELGDAVRHPYRLQCEQFKLTRLIASRLSDHPHGRMVFSRRLVYFEQDDAGVTVTVEAPTEIETYRADYLIGADGANSIVRKLTGIGFSGFTYPERFLTLSTRWPIERAFEDLAYVAYMADPREWCVLLRVRDFWRVLVPAAADESDEHLLSDEKKSAVFAGLIGRDGEEVETNHRTLYRVHQRVADSYRRGRVLLVGDAAHLNNPLGGFGMNSGVHDAWNLTGKLHEILKNGADAEVELNRFERQRRTVMKEFVQAQTIRNKAALEGGAATQAKVQADLAAVIADPGRRRDYLLNQAMVTSLEREAQVA